MPKANQIYHKRPDIEKGIYYAQACKAGNMLFVSGALAGTPREISSARAT